MNTAVMTKSDTYADRRVVLKEAAKALNKMEKLKQDMRQTEEEVRTLCRRYDSVSGLRGCQSYHLRMACQEHGLIKR